MNSTPDGHEKRQAAKRAEILDAAREIFFQEGYARATMDQVLEKIGGSKRTLYKHFPSKDELFEALVTSVSDQVLAALEPDMDAGDIRDTLLEMGVGYLTVLLSDDGRALYRAMVSEAPHFPDLARSFFENGPGRASAAVGAFFSELKKAGKLDVRDPQLAGEQFLGMVRGDIHLKAIFSAYVPSKRTIKTAVSQAVESFLCGIAPGLCSR